MKFYLNEFLFGVYPYIACIVFVVGSIARYQYSEYQWKSGSSQLLENTSLRWASPLFHIGVIAILLGHFVGLLTPACIYELIMTPQTKQLLAVVVGGFFGIICFIGLSGLVYRRLFIARIRKSSSFSDILILLLLYMQLLLGLLSIKVSVHHMDGAVMKSLAHWAQSIVTFQSNAASFIIDQHWIFKSHIFLGLTIILIFPLTRLVHVWSIPMGYMFKTGYQIVKTRGGS